MTIDDLKKFASDLGLAHIEAIVTPGTTMHRMTISGVDYFFYNHDFSRPNQPEWPTINIKEYDGWGSGRIDIVKDASEGNIQGLGRSDSTAYEFGGTGGSP